MTYSEQMSIAVARKVHKRWCRERTPCEYGAEDMAVARDILDGLVAAGFEARVSAERSDPSNLLDPPSQEYREAREAIKNKERTEEEQG